MLKLFIWCALSVISTSLSAFGAIRTTNKVNNPDSLYTLFYFINLEDCARCDRDRISSQLSLLGSLPQTQVIAVIHSFAKDDAILYQKGLSIDSVIYDSGNLSERYQITNYPSVAVLNKMKDVLYKFDNVKTSEQLYNVLSHLLAPIDYNKLPSVSIDKSENGVLGQAQSPYLNFQDSTLYTIDGLRNSIMIYSMKSGKLLHSTTPSEKYNDVFTNSIPKDFLDELQRRKRPLSIFDYIAPLKQQNGYASLVTLIESVKIDTLQQVKGNDTTKQLKSTILSKRVAAIYLKFDSLAGIHFPINNEFSTSFLKLRDTLYYANIIFRNPNIKHNSAQDTTYLFYIAPSATLTNGRFFLPLSKLKHYYTINTFIPSSGILEYNSLPNLFVFANPWNNIFCLSTSDEQITPIQPVGNFKRTFAEFRPDSSDFMYGKSVDKLTFFMNSILSNSHSFYVLIQANNNKTSDYCVIQEYSWKGKFIREIPIILKDNKLNVIHLIGCTENELYLLGKSLSGGWEIKKMDLNQ